MRISRLKVVNYCQHAERDDEFGPGVTGIVGKNGCGKSNLKSAMRRAFTGSSGNEGTNVDDVAWGAEKGSLAVEFVVGTMTGVIKRDLKTARCSMKFGDVEAKSATDIATALDSILGMPVKMLSDVVFVNQGSIEGMLFQTPAERAKSFQVLFGTEKAERIHTLLGQELASIVVQSKAELIAQIQSQLEQNVNGPLRAALSDREMALPSILPDAARSTCRMTVAAFESYEKCQPLLVSLRAEKTKAELSLNESERQMQSLEKMRTSLDATYAGISEGAEQAQIRLITAEASHRLYEQRVEARETLATGLAVLALPRPVDPDPENNLAVLEKDLSLFAGTLDASRKLVGSLRGSQGVCPTCLQPVSEAHVARHRQVVEETIPIVADYQHKIEALRSAKNIFIRDVALWDSRRKVAQERVAAAEKLLAATPTVDTDPMLSTKDDQELVDVFRELNTARDKNRFSIQSVAGNIEGRIAAVAALASRIDETLAVMGKAIGLADYVGAQKFLDEDKTATLRVASIDGFIKNLETQKEQLEKQLAAYQEAERNIEPLRRWKSLLERARLVVHHEQLPCVVARSYLKSINTKLAYYMQLFEVPFVLRIQDDLSINCTFAGGNVCPAGRLSGGQKVMAGIAFHFAIHDIFANNLGMMILDEPTVFLDEDHVDCVFNLLERVKSYSRSAGLQLIVITHEMKLAGVFDRVIQL